MTRSFTHVSMMFFAALLCVAPSYAQRQDAPTLLPTDRVWGHDDAPVTVIEYSSQTCPHCATSHETVIPQLVSDYINESAVKLVVRPFPLDSVALTGAVLAYCLPEDQYYPYTSAVYAQQESWMRNRDPGGALVKLAQQYGLGEQDTAACLQDESIQTLVVNYVIQAQEQFDVRGTPTYFVNGVRTNYPQLLTQVGAAIPDDFVPVLYEAPWSSEPQEVYSHDDEAQAGGNVNMLWLVLAGGVVILAVLGFVLYRRRNAR